jgi:uncharacterized protein DUF2188
MPARRVWDVEPCRDGWAVQREGTARAESLHATKRPAVVRGAKLAKAANGHCASRAVMGEIRTSGRTPSIRTRRAGSRARPVGRES